MIPFASQGELSEFVDSLENQMIRDSVDTNINVFKTKEGDLIYPFVQGGREITEVSGIDKVVGEISSSQFATEP